MRRFARRPPHPFMQWNKRTRLFSLVLLLAVMWMLYQRSADPQTWRWLVDDRGDVAQVANEAESRSKSAEWRETIVPGPGAEDSEEQLGFQEDVRALGDKVP